MIDFDDMEPEKRAFLESQGYHNPIPGAITHVRPIEPKRKQAGRGENQLELAFGERLNIAKLHNQIEEWWLKPFTRGLQIGPAMTFQIDFMVWEHAKDETFMIDTKGPWTDGDSRLKIKIAAEKFPMWRWLIVTRANGIWTAKEVTAAKGIGRKYLDLPWLR